MLRIRLMRFGKKHQPFYRIVVIPSFRKATGAYIEAIGWYNPLLPKKPKYKLNKERYDYWIKQGAKPSDAVLKLILPVEEKKKLWPDKPPKKKAKQGDQTADKSQTDQQASGSQDNGQNEGEPQTGDQSAQDQTDKQPEGQENNE